MTSTTGLTRRALLAVVGGLLVLAFGAVPASAHDELRSTSPSNGQSVATTPGSVVLTFDEPAIAMGTQVVVTGPSGSVSAGAARLVGATVVQDVQPGAPAGRYTVTWRVTSDDGHPVSGTFAFTSAAAGAGTPPTATATPTAAPAPDPRRQPLIPSWGWIAAGVLIIVGAIQVARRNRRSGPDA